jgi:hypothetical protein
LAFVGVQQGLFSLDLGCSFAPNHMGMPIIEGDKETSVARRQVITPATSPARSQPSCSAGMMPRRARTALMNAGSPLEVATVTFRDPRSVPAKV